MTMLATAPTAHLRKTPHLPEGPPGKPLRGVLVVDDEEMVRTMLGLFFRQQGLPVWIAASGAEALEIYEEHACDIAMILLDVRMPDMDGPQTLARLRDINPTLRCYFMSGDYAPYDEAELTHAGAMGVVIKPFLLKMLGEIVRTCVTESA